MAKKDKAKNALELFKEDNRLTVQEIAERFGFSHSHVWKMLRGYKPISRRVLAVIRMAKEPRALILRK